MLLDDDFSAIVGAVRLGRRIDDKLRKAMAFVLAVHVLAVHVLAVHVPIAGLSLLPLLLGWPLLFTPLHIAFLALLIDPACSIAFESEPEEPDVMQRPPRDLAAPLFSTGLIAASLGQGLWVLLLVGAFFRTCLQTAVPEAQARAATFAALVLSSLALILVNRSLPGALGRVLRASNARAALVRSQALQAQGFIGQAALDEAGRAATLADAQWRAAQKQLEATADTGSDAAPAAAPGPAQRRLG